MLDFGWSELALIIAVAVLVVGPKEIPQLMYGLGRMVRRLQYMRYALTSQFDDFMREADLEEMRNAASHRKHLDDIDEAAADAEVEEMEMMPQDPEKKKATGDSDD